MGIIVENNISNYVFDYLKDTVGEKFNIYKMVYHEENQCFSHSYHPISLFLEAIIAFVCSVYDMFFHIL